MKQKVNGKHTFFKIQITVQKRAVESIKAVTKASLESRSRFKTRFSQVQEHRPKKWVVCLNFTLFSGSLEHNNLGPGPKI